MNWKLRNLETPQVTYSGEEINVMLKNCENSDEYLLVLTTLWSYFSVENEFEEFIKAAINNVTTRFRMQKVSEWLVEFFFLNEKEDLRSFVIDLMIQRIEYLMQNGMYDKC